MRKRASALFRNTHLCLLILLATACLVSAESSVPSVMVKPVQIEISLVPGESYRTHLEIINDTSKDVSFEIMKMDLDQDGRSMTFLASNTLPSSIASWITTPLDFITVEAGGTAELPVVIMRPEEDPPAARWGCLMIESMEAITTTTEGMGIKVRFAVGIFQIEPLFTEMAGRVADMQVTVEQEEAGEGGNVTILLAFANTCNNILKMDVHFEIRDETGAVIANRDQQGKLVLPEHTRSFSTSFPAGNWSPGEYLALAIIDYGGENRVGGQWGFEIPEKE